jgi:predicted RNA-binding protein
MSREDIYIFQSKKNVIKIGEKYRDIEKKFKVGTWKSPNKKAASEDAASLKI